MPKYIINPKTGRKIVVNGPTYNKIFNKKQKKIYKATCISKSSHCDDLRRKSLRSNDFLIKGWGNFKPKKGKERSKMLDKCGKKCFLIPKNQGFPICRKNCNFDCRGIIAAKIRAAQWKYPNIYNKAVLLQQKYCL